MRFRKGFEAGAVALAVLALDRLTKHWAMGLTGPVVAVPGVLQWRYCENTGAAFSALRNSGALVGWISAALLAVLVVYLLRRPRMAWGAQLCLWAVVAGGLSNLYDRVRWGYVVDFIEPLFVQFAVFNVADCCITVGALSAAIWMLCRGENAV